MYFGKNKKQQQKTTLRALWESMQERRFEKTLQCDTRTFHNETRDKPETQSSQDKGKSLTKCHRFKCKNNKKKMNYETQRNLPVF